MTVPARPSTAWRYVAVFAVGALLGALAAVQVVPASKLTGSENAIPQPGETIIEGTGGPLPGQTILPSGSATLGGDNQNPGGPTTPGACGKSNAAVPGVSANEIRLATTVVDSGIGASFLRDVRFAMEAVRIKVNQAGGICGRRITIRYIDDGWDAQKGGQFLRNLILEPNPSKQIFAIPVGPSSEGLRVVINSGDVDRSKTPVVGTDGLLIEQYQKESGGAQPWVWPVASATVASARIIVKDAIARGAKEPSDFSVVFDKNYRFGVEGARAFNAQVRSSLHKGNIPGFNTAGTCDNHFCGVQAGQSSYSTDVATFKPGKIVVLFLEPQTALTWMNDPNTEPANYSGYTLGYAAAQPLFTRDFAVNCQSKCDQMRVWTSFKPFIESYKNDPDVRRYVQDLDRANPQADEFNAFAEGGYVGMNLLVEGLKAAGGNLTRGTLKAALDNICITPGLTIQTKLCWTSTSRYANTTMQQFTIQYKGTFSGWRTGVIVEDPRPTVGIGD